MSSFRVFGVFRGSPVFGDKNEYLVAAPQYRATAGVAKVMVKQRVLGRNQTPLGVRRNSSFVLRLPAEPPSYYSPIR